MKRLILAITVNDDSTISRMGESIKDILYDLADNLVDADGNVVSPAGFPEIEDITYEVVE